MRTATSQLIRYFSTVADRRGDGELLAGFLTQNAEADFAELVRRHGPLVWGACRRALPDHADAEDAFQSVFLVLVQRGHRLVHSPCIGPWLHRVAVWTARNLRRRNARRLAKRETISEQLLCSPVNPDLSLDLDAALLALPEKYRSSIVLCHLLGFSRADAAAQLGCAERTLSSWLSCGLAQLRKKLPGLDPTKALGVTGVLVPVGLANSVVHAALSQRSAVVAASVLSNSINQLVEGVIRMFWIKKASAAAMGLFTVFALGVGVGLSTRQLAPASGGEENGLVQQLAAKAVLSDESDIDAIMAALEREIQIAEVASLALQAGHSPVPVEDRVAYITKCVSFGVVTQDDLETFVRFEKDRDLNDKIKGLAEKLGSLKTLKALKAQEKADSAKGQPALKTPQAPKPLPTTQMDLDKQLEDLKAQMRKLQTQVQEAVEESQVARARAEELKAQAGATSKRIAELEVQKAKAQALAAPISQGGYLFLNVDAKEKTWPFQVKEFGPDGKPLGTTAFENAEVFGRFLARILKDPKGPKELQISRSTPHNLFDPVEAVCKAVGFKMVVVGTGDNKAANPADRLKEAIDQAKALDDIKQETEKLLLKKKKEDRLRELVEELDRLVEMNKEQEKLRELQERKKQSEKKAPQEPVDPTKPSEQ